jgi:hypothetical protein
MFPVQKFYDFPEVIYMKFFKEYTECLSGIYGTSVRDIQDICPGYTGCLWDIQDVCPGYEGEDAPIGCLLMNDYLLDVGMIHQ